MTEKSEKAELAQAIRSFGDVRRAALSKKLTVAEQEFVEVNHGEFLAHVQFAIALERWLQQPQPRAIPELPETTFRRVPPGTLWKHGKVHSDCLPPGDFEARCDEFFEDVDLAITI